MLFPDEQSRAGRLEIARDHLGKILQRVEQFHRAMDVPAETPEGLSLYLILGDAIKTAAKMEVNLEDGSYKVVDYHPGDGAVLRSSALLDERVGGEWSPRLVTPVKWSHVTFLFQDHIGLTQDPVFVDNILYLLLEEPI